MSICVISSITFLLIRGSSIVGVTLVMFVFIKIVNYTADGLYVFYLVAYFVFKFFENFVK